WSAPCNLSIPHYQGPTPLLPVLRLTPRASKASSNLSPNTFRNTAQQISRGLPVWCGLRPCSPDGLPYVRRFEGYSNLSAATGHAMMGLSLGPITGKLMSQILSDEKPAIDLTPLKPGRYG